MKIEKPKSAEERLKELKEKLAENPDLTKEEIAEMLDCPYEDTLDCLKEKVNQGYSKLVDLLKDTPDQAKKVKDKIQAIVKSGSKEELIEVLELERVLNKATEGSKKVVKRVKHILNSFVDDIE